jgi:hypothetical protein
MAGYHTFTSLRTTVPDPAQLLTQLRVIDATIGAMTAPDGTTVVAKKNTAWTAPQIASAQTVVDTAPALTPQSVAQTTIDRYPIELRALVLTLIDQLNVLRTHAAIGLTAVTPQQAITAIRNKAATLS